MGINAEENMNPTSNRRIKRVIKGKEVDESETELEWWQKLLYIIYFIGFSLVLMFLLLKLWPRSPVEEPMWCVWIMRLTITEEVRYILMVAVMGALGGLASSARWYAYHTGKKRFKISYTSWYLLRPVIGSILSVIFYFAFRAAFFSLSAETGDLNVFGIATLGGIVGLFSRETIEKLGELFERILPLSKEKTGGGR